MLFGTFLYQKSKKKSKNKISSYLSICSEIPKLKQIALEMKVQQPQEQSAMFAYVRIAEKCDWSDYRFENSSRKRRRISFSD